MLYTALQGYDCSDSYLWVPFDTLLNIPRSQEFDQKFFWYHFSMGLTCQTNSMNITLHTPPANVCPDPSVNLTETWKGWGLD